MWLTFSISILREHLLRNLVGKLVQKYVLKHRNLVFLESRIKKIIKGFSEQNLNSSADMCIESVHSCLKNLFTIHPS